MSVESIFPFGRPVTSGDIVDRREFLAEMQQRLSDGHSLMLPGPRRIGKSSVAHEVLRRMRDTGAYTANVDLFYVTGIDEFAAKLMKSVLENRTGVLGQAIRAMRGLRTLIGQAEVRAKIHDLELGLSLGREETDPLEQLEMAISLAENLAQRDNRRMVILLDEFQEMERLGGQALLQRLRALLQRQTHTVYLFLGSQTTLMQTIFADRGQAFYRFATMMELPSIPAEAWHDYLSKRFVDFRMHFTDPAFRLMMDRTGGHPYCLMAVAYNAHLHANLHHLTTITADVVDYAYEQAMRHLQSIYDVQWQELHRFRHADTVFAALVEGAAPYSLPISGSVVTKAIQNLIRLSIIVKGEGRGEYHLVEPMFGDWLLHQQGR